jgi:hypothetical protein
MDYGRSVGSPWYWDMAVYERGARDLAMHIDPYRLNVTFPFIYHPAVLHTLSAVDRVLALRPALITLYVASLTFATVEIFGAVRRDSDLSRRSDGIGAVVLAGALIGGAPVVALICRNLTPYLHLLILGCLLRYERLRDRGTGLLLVTAVGVTSVVKPYMLSYCALYWIVFERPWRIPAAMGSCGIFLGLWIAGALIWPPEYTAFMVALEKATLLANDLGFSYFGLLTVFTHSIQISMALHTMLAVTSLYFALFIAPQRLGLSGNPFQRILLAVPFVILANPRMKDYDWFLGVLCFALLACLSLRKHARTILLLSALPAALPLVRWWLRLPPGTRGVYQMVSFLILLALFVWIRSENPADVHAALSTTGVPTPRPVPGERDLR